MLWLSQARVGKGMRKECGAGLSRFGKGAATDRLYFKKDNNNTTLGFILHRDLYSA